jgi:succinate dehydrogenase/fumarate reductase cytochrome b subunit
VFRWRTEHKKGGENGIRHWSVGCGYFGICDYALGKSNIEKERKMGFVIGVLVVIALVFAIVYLVQRT